MGNVTNTDQQPIDSNLAYAISFVDDYRKDRSDFDGYISTFELAKMVAQFYATPPTDGESELQQLWRWIYDNYPHINLDQIREKVEEIETATPPPTANKKAGSEPANNLERVNTLKDAKVAKCNCGRQDLQECKIFCLLGNPPNKTIPPNHE